MMTVTVIEFTLDLRANKFSQTAKDAWEAVKAKRSGLDVMY